MTSSRTRDHLRSNAVAYIALFFAITGTAAAIAPQIQGPDIADQAVGTRALRDHGIRKADIGNGAVTSAGVKDHNLTGVDVADDSLGGTQIDETALDPAVFQRRLANNCPFGEAIRSVDPDGTTTCVATGTGTLTGMSTSGGLTGGGISGVVDIGTDPTQLQKRVTGGCSGNNAVQGVNQNGTVGCNPFVTSVTAGTGLLGGTVTNTGTLSVDPAQTQTRVAGNCGGNNAIQSINQNGTVSCQPTGTGTVTSVGVAAGSGLTASPSPITTSGMIGTDFSVVQKRVQGGCTGQEAIQSIDSSGNASCSPSHLLFTGELLIDPNESISMFQANGMVVTGHCNGASPAEATVTIEPTNAGDTLEVASQSHAGGYISFTGSAAQDISGTSVNDQGTFNAYVQGTDASLDGSWQAFNPDVGNNCVFEGSALFS
jgi:hypothetical protein